MKHTIDKRYTFNAEDDWGDYDNGKPRAGHFTKGYCCHNYKCDDGKHHNFLEHRVKWKYFNGDIPEGYEIDHIIPVKNGGTNKLSNLRIVPHKDNMNNKKTIENFKKAKEHISEDTKKKISESKKGKTNIALAKKVLQYNLNGTFIKEFDSASDAARAKNTFNTLIIRCCNGGFFSKKRNKWVNVSQSLGYIWKWK